MVMDAVNCLKGCRQVVIMIIIIDGDGDGDHHLCSQQGSSFLDELERQVILKHSHSSVFNPMYSSWETQKKGGIAKIFLFFNLKLSL